jgi:hypothetical protein
MACAIIFGRPFFYQKGLSFCVATLLAPVAGNGIPPVVPNDRPGAESDREAGFLYAPANIHIISRHSEALIESPDGQQSFLAESHVTARNVFGYIIGYQDVHGPARRIRHAIGDETIIVRRDVRTAYGGMLGLLEAGRQKQ